VSRLQLYSYWRSSAAYRVRIALALKGLDWTTAAVHLVRDGGEQHGPSYRRINPQALVPSLVAGDHVLTQSLAIIEYLDETCPEPPLLPADPLGRARVRSLAQVVACDIHPLNNLRVLQWLKGHLGADDGQRDQWYRHWIAEGFAAIEAALCASPDTGRFCHGDRPTVADLCLVPQVYNAVRYECDLEPYPEIRRVNAACLELEAFRGAAPEAQPDA
jgi:maleylacetoacetate isomerase